VRQTEVGTPVTATDGDDAELGDDDGGADGGSDLLGGLDAETDVALGVTNDDNGLETGTLTGTGLLLDRLDLYRQGKESQSLAKTGFLFHQYLIMVEQRCSRHSFPFELSNLLRET
jgi:hypothetical protein